MPLSPPVGRQHLHTRSVTCQGFYPRRRALRHRGPHHRREDLRACQRMARAAAARRLRARHVDPPHDRPSLHHRRRRSGDRQVAVPDVRRHHAQLQEADRAAHRRRLPRAPCANGWAAPRAARTSSSCSGPVATTAFQTAGSRKARDLETRVPRSRSASRRSRDDPSKPQRKPYMLDSCHTWASDSEVTRRWVPQFYTGPDAEAVREAAKNKKIEMDG